MPSYLVSIRTPMCAAVGCSKKATVTLFNGVNAKIADYCSACGQRVLARVRASESAAGGTETR